MGPFDDDAVRHEAMTDLAASYFIEAGAGTGKTSILVGRVMEILCGGAAAIGQIVMITFTEKAAGELRSRIRKELHEALSTDDAARKARVTSAIEELETAHIETIHSFASGLLREHPLEAGVDANFEQLDEVGAELDFQERWTDWLWGPNDRVARLIERCLRLRMTLESLRKAARLVARYPEVNPPGNPPAPPTPQTVLARLRSIADQARPSLAACNSDSDRGFQSFMRLNALIQQASALPTSLLEPELCNCDFRFDKGNARNWDPSGRDEVIAALEDASRELGQYRRCVVDTVMADLAQALSEFVRESARHRIDHGRLSFEDLLLEARQLLRAHPEVLEQVRKRFRFILVDEFQDTDPVQAEIVFLLGSESAWAPGSSWAGLLLVPGKLFLVGDPKQSIYRFRRADIEAYAEAKEVFAASERAETGGRVRAIVRNFRSVPGVVTWVNGAFAAVLRPVAGFPGAQPEYLNIEPTRADGPAAGVHYLVPALDQGGARLADLRSAEGAAVARLVGAIAGSWEVQGRGKTRPARWRDVCLLVETRTGIEAYTDALDQAGIPYILDGGRSFFQRQEIRDITAILRALDDPSDGVSLVASLKSDAFACSDAELLAYRISGGRLSITAPPVGEGAVADALARLRTLYDEKTSLSLPAFVDLVIRDSCLAEALLCLGQHQRATTLKLIVERASVFAANEIDALRPFIRWLSERQAEGIGEQESQSNELDDDVVRVMTIHGAKGLEFPVVILAKLAGGSGGSENVAVSRSQNCLEFQVSANRLTFDTPGFQHASAREQVFENAETVRKLYVAATRARDHLVISGFTSKDFPGLHTYLPAIGQVGESTEALLVGPFDSQLIRERDLPPPQTPAQEDQPVHDGIVSAWRDRQALIQDHASAGPRYVAPSILSDDLVKKPRETEPEDRSEPECDLDLLGDGQRALGTMGGSEGVAFTGSSSGRSRGSLVHEVLFRCDLSSVQSGEEWTGRICAQRGALGLEAEVAAHVRSVLASPTMRRVAEALRIEKELPVVWFDGNTYVEGFVDIAFEEAKGWVILDYKSDVLRTGPEGLANRYRRQVLAYREALTAAGVHVSETGVWSTQTGEAVLVKP